ncbi:MAG: protein phosphatase 2C domain-containing protein [Chloroflexota bacterium]|nr:protein phosphatase 2C domain-containing protein [Chloroflexota bacterium]
MTISGDGPAEPDAPAAAPPSDPAGLPPPNRGAVIRPVTPGAADAESPPVPAAGDAEARRRRVIQPLGDAGEQGADRSRRVIRRLGDAPAAPAHPAGGIRRLDPPGTGSPPGRSLIRRLAAGGDNGKTSGAIIRPLAPLPPGMPGGRDRKTGIIRPLAALPPLPGSSPEELAGRRSKREARLATILRPLNPLPPVAPLDPAMLDPNLRTAPLPSLADVVPSVICRRCETANRPDLMFCGTCGGTLPAAAGLYDTLTEEYETMQSAERPKATYIPLLASGRRGPNWQAYGLSDKGMVRTNNEDSMVADPLPGSGWLLMVADGMGGAEAGEVASSQTAAIVRELIKNRMELDSDPDTEHRPWLIQAIEQANSLLHHQASEEPHLRGMGTTATVGIVQGLCLELGHVGDSRCYRLPAAGPLQQLTTDHAIVAHLVRLGQIAPDEAESHPLRNQLYRAVATASTIEVDATLHILAPTDRLLFCSDGLTLHLADADIESILRTAPTPQEACRQLVERTLQRGAGDNVSAIVLMAG